MTQARTSRPAHTHFQRASGALVTVIVVLLASCTGPAPDARDGGLASVARGPSVGAAGGGSGTARAEGGGQDHLEAVKLLTATPVELRRPRVQMFHRTVDGTVLVVFNQMVVPPRTRYRIYSRRWEPLTPLLEVRVELHVLRGVDDGFLAAVDTLPHGLRRGGVVHISFDGSLRALPQAGSASTPEPGDVLLHRRMERSRPLLFRPSDRGFSDASGEEGLPGELFAVESLGGQPPPRRLWIPGFLWPEFPCVLNYPDQPGLLIQQLDVEAYWSLDGGLTWRRTRLDPGVLPADWPRRVLGCQVRGSSGSAGGRMVLLTDNGPRNDTSTAGDRGVLYTLAVNPDNGSADLASALPVDPRKYRLQEWGWWVTADGRALLLPARSIRGIWVGTDSANSSLRLQEMPRLGYRSIVDANGLLVMHDYVGTRLHTSVDGGATWRLVDLRGDSWMTPSSPRG